MTGKIVQHRRGTDAEHTAFTGAQGEFTYNTITKRIHAHDGLTPGGIPTAKKSEAVDPAVLAQDTGSSLVGFRQGGAGAVATNVQSKLSEIISVQDFGAVGNGTTDDTVAIQAAINAAIAQRKSLYFPRTNLGTLGLYRITAPLTISGALRIFADGPHYSGLLCANCSGFRINAGVNFVTIEKMAIVQLTRWSTTPNSHRAIATLGTTSSRNFWHTYRDLFIDGFEWAFHVPFTWSTVFNSIVSVFGFGGINAPGQSVNNFVSNCSLGGSATVGATGTAGSVGIQIGDGVTPTEGWMIQDSLLAYFAVGVQGVYANNCHVRGCIIDFFAQRGVALISSANGPSTNWIISDNYMATEQAGGATGVWLNNNHSASSVQHRGTVVSNNQILRYADGVAQLAFGILQSGSAETNNIITGNRVAATTYACEIRAGTNTVVANNMWKAGTFHAQVLTNYYGNEGSVSSSAVLLKQSNGIGSFYYNSAAPSSGTFARGDIAWNTQPTAGGTPGWVCVAGGTPGTWRAMANVAA